ncbi:gliding motility-associated-like protein [Flavobacterium sp. HSC-32F16]|uniref:T9SS type B sorting domain-containing protein n=1 Tax=Flavobacterium sp. HSC-32F16 TaxID=2910964 RepID=UPI0020A2387F|nr:choice-of-anchor L domain-containing protein [Flavobacterium sp. HSC-32F16]MCP2027694.1 gliding motility-associated-like protein [Flavobacterium sp. HSC-32F16]
MNAQITIDDTKTPQQLIDNVLVNSSCAAASNSTGFGDTYTSGKQSFAYFNRNGSSFPFEEGIVLTTSTSTDAGKYYESSMGGGSPFWAGDTDLNQILGINSINATVLEFDFVPLTDYLSFNYIFASNEYQYVFPCEYSDGFAFLIKEAGTTEPYKNLAVIPNTNVPVSSFNVKPQIVPGIRPNGDAYVGCPASYETYFNGFNTNTSPVNYAGQTVVMTAQTTVTKGKTYHIKLVVADANTRYYDSAVFLQAGSFASNIDFGPNRTASSDNPLCFGDTYLLDPKLSPAYSYKWYKDNVEIATAPTYTVTQPGNYKVEVTLTPTSCSLAGEIKIDYAPEILSTNTSLLQCDDNSDGISIFNLSKANNIVKNNVASIINEGYYTTLANAQTKTNKIATPNNYTNTANNQIVYARLENEFGCFKIAEVTLQIAATSIADPDPISTCDGDEVQDGLYQFDLNAEVTPQITSGLPSGLTVNYYLTANDALTETNQLPVIFKNTIAYNQTIYARVVNGPDCYDVVPVPLVINTFNPPNFEDESVYLCRDSDVTLSVATGFSSYLWSNGETTNSTVITAPGDYTVTAKDANGCEKTKTFKVILSEPATITNAVVRDFSGNDNSVLIEYTGAGNYEFSLDGLTYQNDPLFTGIATGIYYAIARDKNGCGLSNSFLLYVLDYPRFFTPNGDGYNDLWVIEDSNVLPNYTIHIFDRYGKLLKEMNQNSTGWNGLFNGQQLPSDDYWFTLVFADGRNVKGHFSLKR